MNFLEKFFSNSFERVVDNVFKRNMHEYINSQVGPKALFSNIANYNTNIKTYNTATWDSSTDPNLLVSASNDPVILAIKNSIKTQLLEKGYYFKTGKNKANYYNQLLESLGYENFINESFEALYGSGGGNCLVYIINDGQGDKIQVEPFFYNGTYRVKVIQDLNNKTIAKYEIYNPYGTRINVLDPDECIHLRAVDDGFSAFSGSPLKSVVPFYVLKRQVLLSIQSLAENSLESKQILSIKRELFSMDSDYSDLLFQLIDKWESWRNTLTDRLPGFIAPPVPVEANSLTQKIDSPETILKYIDSMIATAYQTSLSIVGIIEGVKYSNAEQGHDDFISFAVNPKKTAYQKITEQILAVADPSYNPQITPFCFGVEPDDEILQIREQKIQLITSITPILAQNGVRINKDSLQNLLGEFGIEIESITGEAISSNVENEIDSLENQSIRKSPQKKTLKDYEKGLGFDTLKDKEKVKDSKKIIYKAIERQIKDSKEIKTRAFEAKPIETYLNIDGYKKAVRGVAQATLEMYNELYSTDHALKLFEEYVDLFSRVSVFGWDKVEIEKYDTKTIDMVSIPKTYQGIDIETSKALLGITDPKGLDTVITTRQEQVWDGLESSVFNNTKFELAKEDDREYCGVVTSADDKVRPSHRANEMRYSTAGEMRKFANEANCRCTYIFATEEELKDLGFTKK